MALFLLCSKAVNVNGAAMGWKLHTPIAITAAVLATICMLGTGVADPVSPYDLTLIPFEIQQGDFTTVALNWADTALSTNAYDVQSSPGQLHNYIVPYTGSSGLSPNGAGIETPYNASTGSTDYYFQTGLFATGGFGGTGAGCAPSCLPNPDPGTDSFSNPIPGGTGHTWDASISALNTALGGAPAVFYFNLNETGNTDTLSGIDLLLWGAITLHDTTGILPDETFYLTNETPATPGFQGSGPDPTLGTCDVNPVNPYSGNSACSSLDANGTTAYQTNADGRWVYVSGYFCIKSDGSLEHYGSCTSTDKANGDQSVQNNLGAKDAAFASWNLTLDSIIADNGCTNGTLTCTNRYDVLQADFRESMLDNGFEQVFIASTASPTSVPEPSTLALFGSALAALGWLLRRRIALRLTDGSGKSVLKRRS